jgi:hypothetical protein
MPCLVVRSSTPNITIRTILRHFGPVCLTVIRYGLPPSYSYKKKPPVAVVAAGGTPVFVMVAPPVRNYVNCYAILPPYRLL